MTTPTVWRLHLRTSFLGENGPVKTCLDKKIIGIGWGGLPRVPATSQEYRELGKEKYSKDTGWTRASNAFINNMNVDDLVWFRSKDGIYYLGRVIGDWQYTAEYEGIVDLCNIRPANIARIGAEDAVPGSVVASFRSRATIQRIVSSKTAVNFTIYKASEMFPDAGYAVRIEDRMDIFGLLDDVELEDLVGIYLQHEYGYMLIPSTRGRAGDTIQYEYMLKSRNGVENIAVQVKSGGAAIVSKHYDKLLDSKSVSRVYLFEAAERVKSHREDKIVVLSKKTLSEFIRQHRECLPKSFHAWLELAGI